MQQHKYKRADGSFDYEAYVKEQTEGNKAKLGRQWVKEPTIAFLSGYLLSVTSIKAGGICHGTRRGMEQIWFRKYLGCEVFGTEISETAESFPYTIRWDFHETKPEWFGHFSFIYSNSWDHSYDPNKAFPAWFSSLRPGGIMLLEHGKEHRHATKMDPLGMSFGELLEMMTTLGRISVLPGHNPELNTRYIAVQKL